MPGTRAMHAVTTRTACLSDSLMPRSKRNSQASHEKPCRHWQSRQRIKSLAPNRASKQTALLHFETGRDRTSCAPVCQCAVWFLGVWKVSDGLALEMNPDTSN